MADNVTGIVLDIPANVLQNIKNADKAIRDLEQTSLEAARNVKFDFDTTMVNGVDAFIRKVQEAQTKLGGLKMPTIDATGLSSAIQALSQAMATIDKSATTGSNRLTRIANAMTALQTANPDPQLFQNIADGITKIGNTSQQTIQNVTQLAQVMAQLAKDIRTVQQAQNAQTANTATAAQYNKLFKEQADLVRRINEIKSKGADADGRDLTLLDRMRARYDEINQQLDKLNRKKQTAASELARTQGYNRVGNAQARTDVSGAMNYAKQAKSLQELQAAYKNLKAVMATVDPKSSAWQQMNAVLGQTRTRIDEIKKEMGEFKNQASQVGDVAGQLKRTLAAAFSISAITGYINKLIETRAQFELQQTALRAILQDKQKADEIFQQVQQMALQSPFSIMQMTTFTKQLAAYRIEADKLVGTTKMLADVSAGLGVDMQRLILAYGQVKAANYLRAAEVRQFTEAGLNIAGELATYFSELQGKMISVGDVMEMITKRMVRFEDVEEVFKRVTSASGLFYDMQKKQSETLWGQLQRIKDAMSIMFNEIGKSNQGTISSVLTLVRSLINHWRMLAPTIMSVGAAMATVLAVQGIKAFISSLRTMGAAVATLALKWKGVESAAAAAAVAERGAAMATGIGLAVTAVTMLAGALYGAYQEAHKLDEEFDRISEESSKDMWDLIFKFQEGADAVRDTTKSYEERQKALEDLQNTFRGILPDQDLEYDNIIRITDGYEGATEAIKAYSAEKAKQTAEDAIKTEVNKKWEEIIDRAKDKIAPKLPANFKSLESASEGALRGVVGNIMLQIREEAEKGMIKTGEDAYNRFIQVLESRFGKLKENNTTVNNVRQAVSDALQPRATWGTKDLFATTMDEVLNYASEKQQEFAEEHAMVNTEMTQEDIVALKKYQDAYQKRIDALNRFANAMEHVRDLMSKGDLFGKSVLHPEDKRGYTDSGIEAVDELAQAYMYINGYRKELGLAKLDWQDVKATMKSATGQMLYMDEVQQDLLGGFLKNLNEATNRNPLKRWSQESLKHINSLGESQRNIIEKGHQILTLFGLQPQLLDKLKVSANTNYTAAANDAKKLSEEAAENIQRITATKLSIIDLGRMSGKVVSDAEAQKQAEEQYGLKVDELEQQEKAWAMMAKMWGAFEKSGRRRDIWTPRLDLMQKVNKEYEKLLKYYSKEEAMARIRTSYGDAVAEAFKGTQWADISKWGTFDAQATVDRLKKLAEKAGKDAKKKILEAAGTLQAEIDIKIEEKNIQEAKDKIQSLFDNYELTKTLGGLGLNIDLTYLVGGKPVKLEDLRKQLEQELSTVKATGGEEDTVKAYEEALRKVADLENKSAVERLENYSKYLLESMSERVQIELKAQQEISKIRNDATLDDFSKEQAINNVRKKMQEDLTKYDFDQFKGSEVYLQTFKDLERASKTQLQYVIDKLKELSAVNKNLSPLQVKSIAQEIKKAEDALGDKAAVTSVFSNLKKSIQYAKHRNELLNKQVLIQALLDEQQKVQSKEEKKLYNLTQARDAIQDKSSQEWKDANDAVVKQQRHLSVIQSVLEKYKKDLNEVTDQISAGEKAWNDFQGAVSKVREALGRATDAMTSVFEGLDSMGLVSDSMRDGFESVSEILGGIDKTMQGLESIDITKPFSIITGTAKTIGGIFSTIGGFFGIGDKKKERQIKRLQEKVEDLQKAYEKLQTAIEEAYAFDNYNAGYNQSMRNLQEQRAATQEQLALEKSKKKSDKDKIREYEDALDELKEKEKELREARYEAMGSVGEKGIRTEAENFVSAWLDAYKETGDGLDALTEHWDEFFENLVLKQAASAVVSKRMKKYVDQINAAIDSGDTGLSLSQAFAQIGQNLKSELGAWNEDLKAFFDAVGIKGGQGELLLSDLQKGIQNITEPQAAAIEAYLNSMRFAVFEQNNILTEMLSAIQAQYGSNDNSPMLQEVRAIRSLVASIDDRLSRVIVQRSSANTSYALVIR